MTLTIDFKAPRIEPKTSGYYPPKYSHTKQSLNVPLTYLLRRKS